jgi:hypothetical protein
MKSCGLRVLFATAAVGFWSSAAFGEFIHPAKPGDPLIYGVRNGIFVALHPFGLDGRPQGGPRGLIRVGYEENGQRYLSHERFGLSQEAVGTMKGSGWPSSGSSEGASTINRSTAA